MFEETRSQKFKSKNIDKTRNYFLKEIKQNELMSIIHKKVCTSLNYIEDFLSLVSTISGSISISAWTSLTGISIEITGSAIGWKIFAITAVI